MSTDVCDYVTECNEWAEVSRGLFLGHYQVKGYAIASLTVMFYDQTTLGFHGYQKLRILVCTDSNMVAWGRAEEVGGGG